MLESHSFFNIKNQVKGNLDISIGSQKVDSIIIMLQNADTLGLVVIKQHSDDSFINLYVTM